MQSLRTDDARFHGLPGFAFTPHYLLDLPGRPGLRLHYLDEGPRDAAVTFLCLHGQPTWSYLYRKMVPIFAAAGHRVVAPDLFGFGRSDKPIDEAVYSFDFHRDTLLAFIIALDLRNIALVCQDWGGILGLTLPPALPDRFGRLLVMNTTIPVGEPVSEGFDRWRAFNRSRPDLDIPALMKRSQPDMTDAEAAAYGAPFPDALHKAGVRRFPELVMTAPDMPGVATARAAARWWQQEWRGPSFMAVGMADPVLGPDVMARLRGIIHGCPAPLEIADGGHFVQEKGDIIARAALQAFGL
ncbi:haloalkane dehalogenase [Sandarakinorhabdus cyanobacteriorum]|uniref:Haloalkane dehalogenase n=1 Tax=Sandarakinorhabdus cyanobacteriorum TaxID=1981098 RepID=A0A255Z8Q6_9SPHN|nr:haloalkane dehalogenase [Sandarakinorhabdus cyanobacteriorum]OYQ37933.1 haloalkane dehalogenase [Sandarakinorhabdus cyanobacteriorum]